MMLATYYKQKQIESLTKNEIEFVILISLKLKGRFYHQLIIVLIKYLLCSTTILNLKYERKNWIIRLSS